MQWQLKYITTCNFITFTSSDLLFGYVVILIHEIVWRIWVFWKQFIEVQDRNSSLFVDFAMLNQNLLCWLMDLFYELTFVMLHTYLNIKGCKTIRTTMWLGYCWSEQRFSSTYLIPLQISVRLALWARIWVTFFSLLSHWHWLWVTPNFLFNEHHGSSPGGKVAKYRS
jgi:hypothetical protein